MKISQLLKAFNIDRIIGVDAETFYDTATKYSLKNPSMSNTDYIYDKRFELQTMAVRADNARKTVSMVEPKFKAWAKTINWKRTGVLAHHAQFDGFIMSHHYGIKPACFFDTMSMARPLMPIQTGVSLDAVDRALGGKGKEGTEGLSEVDGIRLAIMTKMQIAKLQTYNCHDVDKLWYIFEKMLPFIPLHELKLIDRTVRMYTDPTLLVDIAAITPVLDNDVANKIALVKKLKLVKPIGNHQAAKELLSSADSFANLLHEAGVEPQKKVSIKKTETARKKDPFAPEISNWAFSKQDQWFKDLEAHENKRVRDLMAARFAVMSNNIEKRCERLIARAHVGPQPVYLKYYGARPGRWSGGDLVNWQNLSSKRREGGEELRASVHAPPGYVLLIADLSQIEARLNAWDAGQVNILDLFAAKQDVYRYVAAGIFNKPVEKVTDGERFIAKTCVLALGYQAGVKRFVHTVRIGAFGPALDISYRDGEDIHTAWRQTNSRIVQNWKTTQNNVRSAFFGCQQIKHGVMTYEGKRTSRGLIGFQHGPTGMNIRYDDVRPASEGNGFKYLTEYHEGQKGTRTDYTGLYGGILVQNKLEHLGRIIIAEQMLELCEYLPKAKMCMTTHDELVMAVPERQGNKALKAANAIMSRPPTWAKGLPLAVEAHISARYDK